MRLRQLWLIWALAAPASAATFQGLGDLPGGDAESRAFGVSADGSVVVGQSSSASGVEAFVWDTTSGMEGIGDLPGGDFQRSASAASADGAVVVGSGMPGGCCNTEAFRWTSVGMVGLGDLPGGTANSRANGVSADGSVVVGDGESASGPEAFRWTPGGGMAGLGRSPRRQLLQRGDRGVRRRIGRRRAAATPGFPRPSSGMRRTECRGSAISMRANGEISSFALDASGDGSIVVGQGGVFHDRYAFIWDAGNGMRQLDQVLVNDYGLDLTGWTLVSATSISDDGSVIVGYGFHYPPGRNEAWIAMPEPSYAASVYAGAGALAALAARRTRRR